MEKKENPKMRDGIKNNENTVVNEIMSTYEGNSEQDRAEQIVFGWNSIDAAASEIFAGIHRTLLEGMPLFLYKNSNNKSDLVQAVVVRNLDYENRAMTDYGVGIITAGYTMLYPHVDKEYLTELAQDLEKWKVDKKIVEVYKKIIEKN